MKSIKKVTITMSLILAAASLYATGITGQITKKLETENVTVTVGCKGGWVTVVPGDIKTPLTDNSLSGILFVNGKAYVLNRNNIWTEKTISGLTAPSNTSQASEEEGVVKIVTKETEKTISGLTESNKVNEVILPYSSDLGIDITDATLGIVEGKNVIYVQPNFEFYKYDKEHMGTGNTLSTRQQNVINSLEAEIKSADKKIKEKAEKVKKELNTILAISISSDIKQDVYCPGNPEINSNEYLRKYLFDGPFNKDEGQEGNKEKTQVLASILFGNKKTNIYKYIDAKGEKIAEAAEKYLDWAVEYNMISDEDRTNGKKEIVKSNPIYSKVDDKWKNTGVQEKDYYPEKEVFPENGNPMPYVKGGVDTPRIFWKKMHERQEFYNKRFKNVGNIRSINVDLNTYKAGIGEEYVRYGGCDGIGMLSGIIEMSEQEELIPDKNGNYPARELREYTKYVMTNITAFDDNKAVDLTSRTKSMRYKIDDIELISTIVPYYSEIKPGDILVKIKGINGDKEIQNVEIAVVTETGNSKDTIKVIYMNNKKAGTAEKIRWSDLKESDEYTPRRLLVRNTIKEYSGEYEAEDWDIMDAKPDIDKSVINIKKKYEQATTTNKNENWRFIPNTGEYLLLDEITVELNNKHGVRINEVYDGKYTIKSICARDRDYNKEKTSTNYGNIYNNKADVFKAAFFGENCKTRLSEINIERLYVDEKEQKITESAKKTENYQTDFYEGNNFAAKFKVSSNGKILPLANNATNIKLGIRPESAEKAFPGDDLILIFKISDGKSDYQIPVNTKDYIAVYDKKMLWRANLYIDEGTNDWNDIHPWNTADNTIGWYGTNSWLVSGTTVAGGQCKINAWTRFNDGETVTDSVAYGWGCWDSVEEFNNELIEQRTAIGQYRTEHPDSDYAALEWNNTQTTAPGTGTGTVRWKNYLFPEIYEDSHNIIYYGINLTEEQKASTTQFPYTIAENFLSIPGFSTYINNDLHKYQIEYDEDKWDISNTANLTSGADCSGLASASMCHRTNGISNYKAVPNSYGFSKMNTTAFADATNTYPIFAATSSNKWEIKEKDEDGEYTETAKKHQKLISHAVPGDILVKAGDHVVIIQNLNYPEDSEVLTDFNQVDVIHSAEGINVTGQTSIYKIIRSTAFQVSSQINLYQLRRLK